MSTSKTKKSMNPLYVVKKNGVDVEEVSGLIELVLKKTGLDKMVSVLETFMQLIFSQVESYAVFIEIKKVCDQVFEKVIEIIFQIQKLSGKI